MTSCEYNKCLLTSPGDVPIEEKSPSLIQVGFKGGSLKRQGAYSKITPIVENRSPRNGITGSKAHECSVANGDESKLALDAFTDDEGET